MNNQKEALVGTRKEIKTMLQILIAQFQAAKSEKDFIGAFATLKFYGEAAQNLLNEYEIKLNKKGENNEN